jgi:hypothetical protein
MGADDVLKILGSGDDTSTVLPEQLRRQLGCVAESLRLDARAMEGVVRGQDAK